MDAPEEAITIEQTQIVKGKRTKRQRPQSPIHNSYGDGYISHEGDTITKNTINDLKEVVTPTLSSDEYMIDRNEEELEDMAKCLILLAQGESRSTHQFPKQSRYDHFQQTGIDNHNNNNNNNSKFNSRRFLETGTSVNGKAGYYVYECKTCNRSFSSFQALGGHRASHKKPKPNHADDYNNNNVEDHDGVSQYKNNKVSSLLSLQLSNNKGLYASLNNGTMNKGNNNHSKVHECSICGAEFTSGQALGGHMRRHRGPVGANTALSLTLPLALGPVNPQHDQQQKKSKNVFSLDLDLNLPAPEDDDNNNDNHSNDVNHRESQLPFGSNQEKKSEEQQQSHLIFSAATLVDCRY